MLAVDGGSKLEIFLPEVELNLSRMRQLDVGRNKYHNKHRY